MSRTIVVGDVHGCIDELTHLLFKDLRVGNDDKIVFLGDLIDRGPDPAGVVALAYEQKNAICIMGNHEEKALRWRKHETKKIANPHYKNPIKSIAPKRIEQWEAIPSIHWDWINAWPKYYHLNERWSAVHAGCLPTVNIEDQDPNVLMRLRYVKAVPSPSMRDCFTYKMASLGEKENWPEDSVHWTELWTGPRSLVYGHYVYRKPALKMAGDNVEILGIDTGCVFGGTLTAFVLHDPEVAVSSHLSKQWEIISIKANKIYSENKAWTEVNA